MNTNTITAAEFIELLKNPNRDNTTIGNRIIVKGNVDITQFEDHNFRLIEVRNVDFLDELNFHDLTALFKVLFIECNFIEGISFNNVISDEQLKKDFTVNFIKCKMKDISLRNCVGINSVSIVQCKMEGGLYIEDCKNMGGLFVARNEDVKTLSISKSKFMRVTIRENKDVNVLLRRSEIEILIIEKNKENFAGIHINRVKSNKINISKNEVTDSIIVFSIQVSDEFAIFDNLVDNQFKLKCGEETNIKYLSVSGGNYGQGFWVYDSTGVKSIHSILYTGTQKNIGSFYFNNLILDSLELKGTINNSSVVLNNITVDNLTFNHLFNYGIVSLAEIKGANLLKINHANLGHCEIINCDFSNYQQVSITNASLVGIKSVQTKWFGKKQLNPSASNIKDIASIKTNREVYRQLKQAMYSQGDTIQALEFKSLEMNAYKQEMNITAVGEWNWKHVSDRFIMFMNQSNNYGLYWPKPVLWAVSFTLLMYIVLSNSFINPEYAMIGKQYGAYLWQYKYRFILLLDPTFDLKKVFDVKPETQLPFSMYALGFIQRIGMTYLIFQTVAAFRKYLK